jgi:hypothetical protein
MSEPLKQTTEVFDEKVLKVEFLSLPAQLPDYVLNLNTETLFYRFQMLMDKVFGPTRVEGFGVTFANNTLTLATGLVMSGPYFIRLAAPQTFALVAQSRKFFAHIAITRMTSDSNPEVVNVNPPLAPMSLPGPNQYRYTVTLVYDAVVPANDGKNIYFKICDVSTAGVVTNQMPLLSTKLGSIDFTDLADTHFTKKGTRETEFVVGYGVLNGGAGYRVLLENNVAPPIPKNFRVVDVATLRSKYASLDMGDAIPLGVIKGVNSTDVAVYVRWNWDGITGIGGPNKFTIDNAAYNANGYFSVDALKDFYVYIPQITTNCRITSNTATVNGTTVIQVVDDDGNAIDLTGTTVLVGNPALIHSNAGSYEIVTIPYQVDGATLDRYDRSEMALSYAESPVPNDAQIHMTIGQKYLVKLRAVKNSAYSDWVVLPAGSFTKYTLPQPYGNPFLVQLPTISSTGASLGVVATPNGFNVSVTGWGEAAFIELCWTTDNAGADFANPNHEHRMISTRTYDVTTSGSRKINVKARPIMAGQAVAAALSKDVTSGSAGTSPSDQNVAQVYVDLRTFSGTMAVDVPTQGWLLSAVVTPAAGILPMGALDKTIVGSILKDSAGHEFIIDEFYGSMKVGLSNLTGANLTPVAGTFDINTTKRGRLVYRELKGLDLELTDGFVDSDVLKGAGCVVRVYQEGATGESQADSCVVSQSDTGFPLTTDIVVSQKNGARYLVIDLFDPNGALNKSGFTGTISIHGRPYIQVKSANVAS